MYSVQCVRKSQRPTVILQGKSLGPVTQSASDSLQQPSASIMRGPAGTHEQPLDERLWQPSFSGRGRSQWELTAGNAIATLSYYANAASANTGWIACPRWLQFRLETAAKRISCNAFYTFFYRFCGSELWCGFFLAWLQTWRRIDFTCVFERYATQSGLKVGHMAFSH